MIEIQFNDHMAEDVKCIQELREMGFSDEYIQRLYDISIKNEASKKAQQKGEM